VRKLAKRKQAKSAAPYVRRLVEDQYVQEQLRNAATRLREAYGRASRQGGKAAEDKKLYGSLREAATSIRKATLALQRRRPEPKRPGRKVLLVALAGGGAALIAKKGRVRERLRGDGAEAAVAANTSASQQSEPAAPARS
jgi:hypothetical protein